MARFSGIWHEIVRCPGAAEPGAEAGEARSRPPQEGPEQGKAKRKKAKAWLGKALAYGLAAAIIAALARGISVEQFARVLKEVNPGLFLLACVGSFLFWFLGDTVSLARLFSYFHVNTTFREMLPGNTAQYFLQTINHVAGGTALAIFMRRSKGVPIVSAGCSMMFLGLIDFLVMGLMGLAAAALVPASLLSAEWYYPAAVTGGIGLFVWFWLRGRPNWKIARRIYDLPSFESLRNARVSHYLRLMLLRGLLFTGEALTLFVQLRSFGVHVPLLQVLAFEPAELFLTALPITPAGLGVIPAVLILGFHAYGSRATLLALGLAISTMGIMLRLPLGFGAAGSFAREVTRAQRAEALGAAVE